METSSTIDTALLRQLAHDIRNPLTAARVLLDLLEEDVPEASRADVREVIEALDQAVVLTESVGFLTPRDGDDGGARRPLSDVVGRVLARPANRQVGGKGHSVRRVPGRLVERGLTQLLANATRMARTEVAVEIHETSLEIVVGGVHLEPAQLRGLREEGGNDVLRQAGYRCTAVGFHPVVADFEQLGIEVRFVGSGDGLVVRLLV